MRQSSGTYASGLHVVADIMAVSIILPILVSPPKPVPVAVPVTFAK
jgi:OFA family oxalate/formate antiporter-like MFS transporter